MAKLTVLEFPDPRLRATAKPVTEFGDHITQTAQDMLETMYAAEGIGLAATQVGIMDRIFVMDISENGDDPQVLVNPRITEKRGEQVYEEGCLSFPGVYANVKRANWIHCEAEDAHGITRTYEVDGLNAVCIQHELDHLDGKVFIDYLSSLKRSMVLRKLEKQRRKAG